MSELRRNDQNVESYLRRLDSALGSLDARERDDILLVTRTHVDEQLDLYPSLAVTDILAKLGEPEEYARRFMVHRAPEAADPDSIRGRFSRLRSAGWKGLLLAPVLLIGYAIVFLMLAIATAKMFAPTDTGLWVYYVDGVRHFSGGINTDKQPGTEVLGYWLVVASLGVATVLHLGLSGLLRLVTRRKRKKSSRDD